MTILIKHVDSVRWTGEEVEALTERVSRTFMQGVFIRLPMGDINTPEQLRQCNLMRFSFLRHAWRWSHPLNTLNGKRQESILTCLVGVSVASGGVLPRPIRVSRRTAVNCNVYKIHITACLGIAPEASNPCAQSSPRYFILINLLFSLAFV